VSAKDAHELVEVYLRAVVLPHHRQDLLPQEVSLPPASHSLTFHK
jgi:hypothetical protein